MNLDECPDELLQQILLHVPPTDTLLNAQFVCKRWWRLCAEARLWKHHCLAEFQHWHSHHDLPSKLGAAASTVAWKALYIYKWSCRRQAAALFEEIVATQWGRIGKMRHIVHMGLDAKDFLLEQWCTPDQADDVFARRHWALAILQCIHRSIAVLHWRDIHTRRAEAWPRTRRSKELERALGAFDMFRFGDGRDDLNMISDKLDEMASQFMATQTQWRDATTRQKALALNHWLRRGNYTGIANVARDYHNFDNCFIGRALMSQDHESLPLISSAIYCCVAERVGLAADCCSIPGHVHVAVSSENGLTLDGNLKDDPQSPPELLYLDPFGDDDEVSLQTIKGRLSQFSWFVDNEANFNPTTSNDVALRLGSSLAASVKFMTQPRRAASLSRDMLDEINLCTYAATWASVMLLPVGSLEWARSLESLSLFRNIVCEDEALLHYFLHRVVHRNRRTRAMGQFLQTMWEEAVRRDSQPPEAMKRNEQDDAELPYKIGQVFRHRTHGWLGVIYGWNRPAAGDTPGEHDAADAQQRAAVYYCMREASNDNYVIKPDNIEIVTDLDSMGEESFPNIGKFFKRFDRDKRCFVSNIKIEYPDD
jgi:F-box protein 21